MHEKTITKIYYKELGIAFAAYLTLLLLSQKFGRPMPEGVLRTLVLISPMAGFGLMIRAVARKLAHSDEYIRQRLLETVALTAAVTAAATFTYGFLETAGFPRLSMFAVWIIMGSAFGVVNIARRVCCR
ncbi:hypothetical protein [Massilia horti]|uniref:Transmembrane protein n=1 Tax=Massilia horti TaxID=2562153 RepID=A0A4Y9SW81_9BURK|nr:hypothetical protein [Massilia horti]TFW28903.1 hypothetical protein E4O92_19910 [Massilia horti]